MIAVPSGTGSRVAIAFDWDANISMAERTIQKLADQNVNKLFHFGRYGVVPDSDGRDWFAEKVEHYCHQHDITIWVDSHDERALASPSNNKEQTKSLTPLLPYGITHQIKASSGVEHLVAWVRSDNSVDAAGVAILERSHTGIAITWITP